MAEDKTIGELTKECDTNLNIWLSTLTERPTAKQIEDWRLNNCDLVIKLPKLSGLSRAELDELANSLGIEDANKFKNKTLLIEAIENINK